MTDWRILCSISDAWRQVSRQFEPGSEQRRACQRIAELLLEGALEVAA